MVVENTLSIGLGIITLHGISLSIQYPNCFHSSSLEFQWLARIFVDSLGTQQLNYVQDGMLSEPGLRLLVTIIATSV
jgi:hypothetical protein